MHTPVGVTEDALRAGPVLRRRLPGGARRRLDHRPVQGDRAAHRPAADRHPDHLCRVGDDADLGETKDGRKTTQRTPRVLPEVVLYDVGLTMTLPAGLSGTSGINAIAHSVEAMYAEDSTRSSVRSPNRASPRWSARCRASRPILPIARRGRTRNTARSWPASAWARSAWRCITSSATRWAACSTCRIPRRTRSSCRTRWPITVRPCRAPWRRWRGRLATTTCRVALFDLAGKVGAPRALRDLGMPESGIERATDQALANPYWNPRPWSGRRSAS